MICVIDHQTSEALERRTPVAGCWGLQGGPLALRKPFSPVGAEIQSRISPRLATVIAFLVALALLCAQVAVTRLLAYRLFYHFVFLVVSLAQLGLAGAGAWIYASGRRSWRPQELIRALVAASALTLVVLAAYAWGSPAPNLSHAKLVGPPAYLYLSLLAVLLVAFNFAGGWVLTVLFTTFKSRIGMLYGGDLLGASLGCLLAVGVMTTSGPVVAFAFSGMVLLGAAFLVARSGPSRPSPVWLLPLALFLGVGWYPGVFDPDLFHPQRAHLFRRTQWDHVARTDQRAPFYYVIDGDASTNLAEEGERPLAPEYRLVRRQPEVAIVGVGAGPQLLAARQQQASAILAIDINPAILRWAQEEDRQHGFALFDSPPTTPALGEGRHVLRSSGRRFDLIVMHAIDTYTASSQGAYSLTENFLYTSEALEDFLGCLQDDGVLSIRRWLFWPPRENLRLFITAFEALKARGAERPGDHLVVISPQPNYRDPKLQVWGYVLIAKQPLGEERLKSLDDFVAEHGWAYLYRPGQALDTPFQEYVSSADQGAFLRDYPYVVSPATDAKPFFFQFDSPLAFLKKKPSESTRVGLTLYGQSSTVLTLCLLLCLVLTLLVVGLPLYRRRADFRGAPTWPRAVAYFSLLGFGFMAFELPVIQSMTLFLGHPTYALSVVLCGLLLAAGLGSVLAGRASYRLGRGAIAVSGLLAGASSIGLLAAVHALIQLDSAQRFALTFLYLALVGLPLGMPFVVGIRCLERDRRHLVSGAWAINGAAGVLGSGLVMMLMVSVGSQFCLAISAVAYGLAWWLVPGREYEALESGESRQGTPEAEEA